MGAQKEDAVLILVESRKASWRKRPLLLFFKDVERLTTPMDNCPTLCTSRMLTHNLQQIYPGNQPRIYKPASRSACYKSDVLEARLVMGQETKQ